MLRPVSKNEFENTAKLWLVITINTKSWSGKTNHYNQELIKWEGQLLIEVFTSVKNLYPGAHETCAHTKPWILRFKYGTVDVLKAITGLYIVDQSRNFFYKVQLFDQVNNFVQIFCEHSYLVGDWLYFYLAQNVRFCTNIRL